jgi:hypothetical protein
MSKNIQVFNSANKLEATIRKYIEEYIPPTKRRNYHITDREQEFAVLVLKEILEECGFDVG